MLERDIIMRMIQTLTEAIGRIVFQKAAMDFPEALEEIQTSGEKIIGMKWELLKKLSDAQVIELLSTDQDLGTPKLYAAGMLMKEEADLDRLAGKPEEEARKDMIALSFLLETYVAAGGAMTPDHVNAIDALLVSLGQFDTPDYIEEKLLHYYELTGQFDKAENVLFELVALDPSYADDGIEFYRRILKKSDEELKKGNLPRNEIEDGIASLHREAHRQN
jgi:Family of unknown function (DUF6483)